MKIVISKTYYDQLLKDSHFLSCLESCGVDNWDGYDDAVEMHQEQGEESEAFD